MKYSTNKDPKTVRLFIVRHGQTDHNVQKILQGHRDVPLNKTGREQAARLGRYWQRNGLQIDRVVSSDLSRCQETARIICGENDARVPLEFTAGLRERNMGPIEGMRIDEAEQYAHRHGHKSYKELGETRDHFRARLRTSLAAAVASGGPNVLVLSHGGAIRAILAMIKDQADPMDNSLVIVYNTSVTVVDYHTETKRFNVQCIGDTAHLGDGEFLVEDYRLR